MMNLISITQARNNLSQLVREVASKGKTFVLLRDSTPQAALVPYADITQKEQSWQKDMDRLMKQGRQAFKRWLKANKVKYPKTEDEIYQLLTLVKVKK